MTGTKLPSDANPKDQAPSLRTVLSGIAKEARDLEGTAGEIQNTVALITAAQSVSPEAVRGLQRLDSLTQALADLARVTEALARSSPEHPVDWTAVVSGIRLARLEARLSGRVPDLDETPATSTAGEVGLF